MAINKVKYAGRTLVDLSGDTVAPSSLLIGETAHSKTGDVIMGTLGKAVCFTKHSTNIITLPNATFVTIGSFTCPSNGHVVVSVGARFSDMGTSVIRRIANVYIDNEESMLWETTCAMGGALWSGGSCVLPCKAGQVIEGKIYHTGGRNGLRTFRTSEFCSSQNNEQRG